MTRGEACIPALSPAKDYDIAMSATTLPTSILPPKSNVDAETQAAILTPEAQTFLAKLAHKFEARRQELLARRHTVQQEINGGKFPNFLPETAEIRRSEWKVAPIPKDLMDRRVEITGPVDRKRIINARTPGPPVHRPLLGA